MASLKQHWNWMCTRFDLKFWKKETENMKNTKKDVIWQTPRFNLAVKTDWCTVLDLLKKTFFPKQSTLRNIFFYKLKLKLLVQFWLIIETIWWRNWESNSKSDNGNCRKPNLHFHQWRPLNRLCGLSGPY